MPVTDIHPIPPSHVLPKGPPASPKRPAKEIVRERSVTPVPAANPRPPSPKEQRPEQDSKFTSEGRSKAPSLAPATPSLQLESESRPEQDDDPSKSLTLIDMDTFNQILELDEDEDTHDFSQPMVWEYFEQAEKTFNDMDIALKKRNLDGLSSLGHFLKGSSAALGLSRVQDSCEKIQHLGHLQDGEHEIKEDEALAKIMKMIKRVRSQYSEAKSWLIDFFGEEVA